MSLFGSLFSSVSGLTAQSRAMGVISDNIANVSTTAYKGSSAQFANLVAGQQGATSYSPGGVRMQAYQNIGATGLIKSTGATLDAAISGSGFFVVNTMADGQGEQVYTRDGAFDADEAGNLMTPSGHFVQGWALDDEGEILDVNDLETVNIRNLPVLAAATTKVGFDANLDADQVPFAGAYAVGDLASGAVQPHLSYPVEVYDSLGRAHNVMVAFLRTDADTWSVEIAADPADVDAAQHPNGLLASGEVTFDGNGALETLNLVPEVAGAAGSTFGVAWDPAGGADPSSITLDLGTIGETDGLSQYAAPSRVGGTTKNGSEAADFVGVSIDKDGFVTASFDNGATRKVFQLSIATFPSPSQLEPRSGNIFAQTEGSGEVVLNPAGFGGAGKIAPSSLEAANVDLADEFTKMIVTQRAYSANAKVVNTADEMLDELIRLGR